MPNEPTAPLPRRHLDALKALALYPRGLRPNAYPSIMRVLQEMGYAEERPMRGRGSRVLWHITPTGRKLLLALGEKPEQERP